MIWYTPTDKRDVRYMPADIALYGIHLQTSKHCTVYACRHSAVWYTPTDIAPYDTNPHTCNLVRCSAHACQRLVSAARSRFPAVLRCVVLMHNNSSHDRVPSPDYSPRTGKVRTHLHTRLFSVSVSSCARAQENPLSVQRRSNRVGGELSHHAARAHSTCAVRR